MTRNNFLLPSLILGMAIVLTGAIATLGFYKTRSLTNTISVTGSAERMIVSDTAKWTMQITHATDVSGLQQSNEAMQNDLEAVKVFLDRKNIPSEWVTTQPVSVETMYDYNRGGAPSGYTLRQNVIVEGTDVNLVRSTAEAAGELIAKGAVVSTLSLEYFYSGLQQLKAEILADAMADARTRATQMVESGGGQAGRPPVSKHGSAPGYSKEFCGYRRLWHVQHFRHRQESDSSGTCILWVEIENQYASLQQSMSS